MHIDDSPRDDPARKATESLDPSRCPLCGGPNDCGAVKGQSTCWCHTAVIPKEVWQRIPVEMRGVACICRSCAGID